MFDIIKDTEHSRQSKTQLLHEYSVSKPGQNMKVLFSLFRSRYLSKSKIQGSVYILYVLIESLLA